MIKTLLFSIKTCRMNLILSLFCLLTISFISGCENSSGNDQDSTGSVSFQIQWPADEDNGISPSQWDAVSDNSGAAEMLTGAANVTVSEDCTSRGIDKVAVEVRDASEHLLVSKQFDCDLGVGKISVPVGSDRLFSISGLDDDGSVRYYGGKDDVTIRAGSNDIGIIQMERSSALCTDNDGDRYYAESDCGTAIDCNDNDATIFPGAIEICGDGIDQDCDGSDAACTSDPDVGRYYGNFAITELKYDDDSDWDQKITEIFGSGYRVADWNDLKAYYNNGGNLLSLYDGLGLTDYGASAYVTRNGDPSYSSTRYYFASRHEGTKPSSYLAHDNIESYTLSLGSWYGTNKIMAIKKDLNQGANDDGATIYFEDFEKDPDFSAVISTNAGKSQVYWTGEDYYAQTFDQNNDWWCIGHSPSFTTFSTNNDFTVEFDFNPVTMDWGSYPGIFFHGSKINNKDDYQTNNENGSLFRFCIAYSDSNYRKLRFLFSNPSGDNLSYITKSVPRDNEWYHVRIAYHAATATADLLVQSGDGTNFYKAENVSAPISGTFQYLSIGDIQGTTAYGDMSEIKVDNISIKR